MGELCLNNFFIDSERIGKGWNTSVFVYIDNKTTISFLTDSPQANMI